MDGPEAGTVAGSHVLVERLDGVGAAHLTVLLVHVVGAGTRVVSDPDTEVLDLERVLLLDLPAVNICVLHHPLPKIKFATHLVERNDLTVRLLDLSELREEVPESALGNDIVWCKDAHAVELWGWVGVRGQKAPNDLVLLQATFGQKNQRCLTEVYVCCVAIIMFNAISAGAFSECWKSRRPQQALSSRSLHHVDSNHPRDTAPAMFLRSTSFSPDVCASCACASIRRRRRRKAYPSVRC